MVTAPRSLTPLAGALVRERVNPAMFTWANTTCARAAGYCRYFPAEPAAGRGGQVGNPQKRGAELHVGVPVRGQRGEHCPVLGELSGELAGAGDAEVQAQGLAALLDGAADMNAAGGPQRRADLPEQRRHRGPAGRAVPGPARV